MLAIPTALVRMPWKLLEYWLVPVKTKGVTPPVLVALVPTISPLRLSYRLETKNLDPGCVVPRFCETNWLTMSLIPEDLRFLPESLLGWAGELLIPGVGPESGHVVFVATLPDARLAQGIRFLVSFFVAPLVHFRIAFLF